MATSQHLAVPRRKVSFSKDMPAADMAMTTPTPSPRKSALQQQSKRPPLKLAIPKYQYNIVDHSDAERPTVVDTMPPAPPKSTFKPVNIHDFLGGVLAQRQTDDAPKVRKYSGEDHRLAVDTSNSVRSVRSAPIKNECDPTEFLLNGFMMNSTSIGDESPLMKFMHMDGGDSAMPQFLPMSEQKSIEQKMCTHSHVPFEHTTRLYPSSHEGPFIVYAEDQNDFIDSIAVAKQIRCTFGESFLKSVQINQRQLKIFMADRESANGLAASAVCGHTVRFCIPRSLIEIMGVVHISPDISSEHLTMLRSFDESCVSEIPGPKILHCQRLGNFSDSWIVLITFEGQKLPSHVELDQCMFLVTRYYAPILICKTCLQYGHNENQCEFLRRCEKCSLTHDHQLDYDNCDKLMCLHCGGDHSALDQTCKVFSSKQRENESGQRKEHDTNWEEWCFFAKQAGLMTYSSNANFESDHWDDLANFKFQLSPTQSVDSNLDRHYDIFISYRRNDGSQLASLIKIALENRNYSVFLDVEGLNAGKVRSNIKQNIKQAKFFLLILTKNALTACIGDDKGKDWVHTEVAIALSTHCEIIPILVEGFVWPKADQLPADMRKVCKYNGVKWVHEYQEACLERLYRFMRGNLINLSASTQQLSLNRSSPVRNVGRANVKNRNTRRRSKSQNDLSALRIIKSVSSFSGDDESLPNNHQNRSQIITKSESSNIMNNIKKKIGIKVKNQ